MKNSAEFWDVLSLTGEREIIEIVSSLLQDKSVGSIDLDQKLLLYFIPQLKNEIDKLLRFFDKNHVYQYKWDIQKIEPWHLSWKDNFKPIYIENKIAIIPDWEECFSYDYVIKIKPGMAFGTGHHETTFLMLEYMLTHNLLSKSVLDLGTGSGILSIAAKLLGANEVVGVEYDPVCKENFLENLAINDISEVEFVCEDATKWTNFGFDFIFANINRNVLLEIIPNIRNTSGRIILSGLLLADENLIRSTCIHNGLNINTVHKKDEWILMDMSIE